MPPALAERAPAKVNLTLAVRARRADGYHDIESLVVFARTGDELRFVPGGDAFGLVVRGRTAQAAGPGADNLVLKAARLLADRVPGLPAGRFTLVKRLPVAAGLGGGSSDAAAALRLLARAAGLGLDDPRLLEAARLTGSDVSVCLVPAARFMRGIGHDLGPPLVLPRLAALLVNPQVAVPTPAVFARLGLATGAVQGADPATVIETVLRPEKSVLLALLAASRNDLEAPALALEPVIGSTLARLRADPACRLARMSGSGATVFGLYDTCRAAAAAGKAISAAHPGWWVKPTMMG
ncbi:MAG: 4-(cytidine 5'-diphospho)-2-C-methyl-D-erythritol kinase [Phreatobacter sp.]|uniref:4-(cytidine 5'-diphospho)-2-C-methyl-D-erythritol kinase n=1 Tax=Phreatobacter sp. TaxID=1966341 RepID=UPI002736FF43|nr:4-(cytidine 5'-diphospho)-2-C-methyl-D-erythritol kinase [Phreatobacter sp.]MDP2802040.1 4-(cytidine 5'-diphospho)-2-C-methyl-D-erythritol kinase [Phreatobacter sp.]